MTSDERQIEDRDGAAKVLGPFAAIVVLAFAVRVLFLLQAREVVFFEHLVVDARAYDAWAHRIRDGDWLSGREVFYQAPLYPYFLAGVESIVGHDLFRVRVVQAAIGALSCGLIFLAGRRFFGRTAGLIAGLMLALYPPAIFCDSLIQKAVLDLFLFSLLLWLLSRAITFGATAGKITGPTMRWAGVGLAAGLLALTRENAIVLVAALPVMSFFLRGGWKLSSRIFFAASIFVGAGVALSPVAARNKTVGGEFALTTSQAGPNFFIGNNPQATGIYAPLRPGRSDTSFERVDARELAENASGRALSAGEVSAYWRGRAFDFIRAEPMKWLKLMGRKSMLLVNAYEIPDAEDMYFYARVSNVLSWIGSVWHFGVLAPLAAAGVVLTWRRHRELWILLAIIALLSASIVLFYVFARYRLSLVPLLIMFAAAAVVEVLAWKRHEKRVLVIAAAFAVAIAILSNWPMFRRGEHIALSFANAASMWAEEKNIPAAVQNFRQALQHNPDLHDVRVNLGLTLANNGDVPAAVAEFEEAVRRAPDHPSAQMWLGTAYAQIGRMDEAIKHLDRAARLDPAAAAPATNLASLQLNLGRWRDGVATLRTATKANPNDETLATMLIIVLATSPDPAVRDVDEAIRLGESLDQKTGGKSLRVLDALATAYESAGRFTDARAKLATAADEARLQKQNALAEEFARRMRAYPK